MFHRYTITGEGASPGYFRLVEDPAGAWVTWAEVEAHSPKASPVLSDLAPLRALIADKVRFWETYRMQPPRSFNASDDPKPQRWIDAENRLMTCFIRDLHELDQLLASLGTGSQK